MIERLENVTTVDRALIAQLVATGKVVTVQFSKPFYDRSLLADLDLVCREFREAVEVRFYGHHPSGFDARNLEFLPNVSWLSVDCLMGVSGVDHLFGLSNLRRLSLGIFDLDIPDVLTRIQIKGLHELRLCETKKNNIDLSPIAQCTQLARLFVGAHRQGLSALKQLGNLTELTLGSFPQKQSLEIVSSIPKLTKLRLILGGRSSIDEISHPVLEQLEVVRVLGMASVGDLSRFPSLQKLRIEDQIRLESLDLSRISPRLRELALINCKKLKLSGSLEHLNRLEDLGIGQTDIDFEAFLESRLPQSLRTVRFWTGNTKTDKAYRAKLNDLGFKEFSSRRMQPCQVAIEGHGDPNP